ncbi:hypothetical protein ILYODFUR_020402 [Ilyodon furcidens]|uniref:SCP2 domain-containing protein n=1 Tax=Ilyodon furcidens TaxID=33524 RepID=A0ABV0TW88_9TELE
MLLVGADIQFRIWNPVMSVVSVQDLNASTRMTAQNALTHSLSKKTVREIQTERVKLEEYLGIDINEMTHPWGLEVDRVELTFGGLLKAPNEGQTAPLTTPPPVPSVPTLEGLTGSLQQLAMHFLSHSGNSQPQQNCLTPPNEVSIEVDAAVAAPGSVEELLSGVQMNLSETLVQQVGACFQFEISTADGQQRQYYLDLSQGSGAAGSGSLCREADVTLSMSDCDLVDMFQGRLRPLAAYTSGSLKVQGDVKMAMKLEKLIKQLKNLLFRGRQEESQSSC